MDIPKVVTQRYFQSHLKELSEPVAVTLQTKGTGIITTLGYYFPNETGVKVERRADGAFIITKS